MCNCCTSIVQIDHYVKHTCVQTEPSTTLPATKCTDTTCKQEDLGVYLNQIYVLYFMQKQHKYIYIMAILLTKQTHFTLLNDLHELCGHKNESTDEHNLNTPS